MTIDISKIDNEVFQVLFEVNKNLVVPIFKTVIDIADSSQLDTIKIAILTEVISSVSKGTISPENASLIATQTIEVIDALGVKASEKLSDVETNVEKSDDAEKQVIVPTTNEEIIPPTI